MILLYEKIYVVTEVDDPVTVRIEKVFKTEEEAEKYVDEISEKMGIGYTYAYHEIDV